MPSLVPIPDAPALGPHAERAPDPLPERFDRSRFWTSLVLGRRKRTLPSWCRLLASRIAIALPSPLSPSGPPRRDRPTRPISDFSPDYPDHALPFTAIRASERFRGRVALPALSCPLPRTTAPKARAPSPRHDAPRGPLGPPRQSTKRPTSTSRRALNSPSETSSRLRWRSERARGGEGRFLRYLGAGC